MQSSSVSSYCWQYREARRYSSKGHCQLEFAQAGRKESISVQNTSTLVWIFRWYGFSCPQTRLCCPEAVQPESVAHMQRDSDLVLQLSVQCASLFWPLRAQGNIQNGVKQVLLSLQYQPGNTPLTQHLRTQAITTTCGFCCCFTNPVHSNGNRVHA